MKLKYYLRGMGIGIILTAIIMGIALRGRKEALSDAEIMARARELGMIDATVLSDYAVQNSQGDAVGGNGENGNAADGSAATTVHSVTQTGDASNGVVFEPLLPPDFADASNGSGSKDSASTEKPSASSSAASVTTSATAASSLSSAVASTGSTSTGAAAQAASTSASTAAAAVSTGEASAVVWASDEDAADAAASKPEPASAGSSKASEAASAKTASADAGASASAATGASASAATGTSAQAAAGTGKSTASQTGASTAEQANAAASTAAGETPVVNEQPAQAAATGKTVVIPSGVGSDTVAAVLEREGIIDSAADFDKYLCDQHLDRILRSGEKTIPEGANYAQIAEILTK
ncbi:MAG: endolytic transglycosylase MltG [Lachnospiraceae bacterium]|nr:endolytic transglycosylase MltG [Lachnospiraceae bacterium]